MPDWEGCEAKARNDSRGGGNLDWVGARQEYEDKMPCRNVHVSGGRGCRPSEGGRPSVSRVFLRLFGWSEHLWIRIYVVCMEKRGVYV